MTLATPTTAQTQTLSLRPPANPIPAAARPRRATAAEKQMRVSYCIRMLMDGRRDHEVKRFFRDQYGVGSRQTQTYLLLARRRLAETNDLDINQLRAEFYARYLQIYRESESDMAKIAALRAASALFGLNAPVKVARTTTTGTDVAVMREAVKGLTIDELRILRKVRDRLRSAGSNDDSRI